MADWRSGLAGAGTGAAVGSTIFPGVGTAIGAGLGLLGGILGHKGKNKEIKQQNQLTDAEYMRRDAEQAKRASGRASFMMGLLNAYGYGGLINEDQARAMLTKSQDRPVAGVQESGLSVLGKGLQDAGGGLISGGGNDFWDQLFEEIAKKPTGLAVPPMDAGAGVGGGAANIAPPGMRP